MKPMNRRQFLGRSAKTAVAMGAASTFSINALGANERIQLGLMGCGGRGKQLATWYAERDDCDIAWVADPDKKRAEIFAGAIEKMTGKRPKMTQNFQDMLDDKGIQGIINATPDHWHAPGTIYACQAGKDVYVEKPASHSIWEGRKMVEAARKYERIVQIGTQCRSAEYCYEAFEYLRSSDFGDIHFARVLNSKQRSAIASKPNTQPPEDVDYDMWLGPAPYRPFNANRFHYGWHWYWDYSGGDIINDGVHQIDVARWLINKKYPKSVCSQGGKFGLDDDQETPDTHVVNWDFEDMTLVFEQTLWAPYMKKTPFPLRDTDQLPEWAFSGTRMEIYGSKQIMFLSRHGGGWQAFDGDGKSVRIQPGRFSPANMAHIGNFLDCIRTRKRPNGDIEEGHLSTLLCHYGNIAYRTGRRLHIDPETEGFKVDKAANDLVKRRYRAPWVIPDEV
ncbi:MAG: Gfo/Idh/MocA family oxidoreductase [bacterium]|nr:Gfo/Idh/MocA family oxidoreductase [bacterium]